MKEKEKFVSTGSFLKAKNTTFVKFVNFHIALYVWVEKVTHKDLCAHIVNHTIYYT